MSGGAKRDIPSQAPEEIFIDADHDHHKNTLLKSVGTHFEGTVAD